MATETRAELLEAAYRVIRDSGVTNLTLEAVASRAGVSKGGVLYHFPTKQALFEALVKQVVAEHERELERMFEAEPVGPGRALRAYVRTASLVRSDDELELTSAIIAAVALDPSWSGLFWPMLQGWRDRVEADGTPPDLAYAVMSAAEGMAVADALGLGVADKSLRRAAVERLLALAGTEGA